MATDTSGDRGGARLPGVPSGTQARCSWRPLSASTALGMVSTIEARVQKTTRNTSRWSAWHARFGRRLRAFAGGTTPEMVYAAPELVEGAARPGDLSTGGRPLPSAGWTADASGMTHPPGDPPPSDRVGQEAAPPSSAGDDEAPRRETAAPPGRISRGGTYAASGPAAARTSVGADMPVQRKVVPGFASSPAMRLASVQHKAVPGPAPPPAMWLAILAPAASAESADGGANGDAMVAPRLALSVSFGTRGPRREGYPGVPMPRPSVRAEQEDSRPAPFLLFRPSAQEQEEAAATNSVPVPLPATVRPTPPETLTPLANRAPDQTPPAPGPRDAIARLLEQTGLPAPLPGLDLRIVTPEERDRAETAPEAPAWKPPMDRKASGRDVAGPPLDIEALADRVVQKIERHQKRERDRKGLY